MSARPEWAVDGADWPNREWSRFLDAGGLRWHVQITGSGPVALLLHGAGAGTHSWRDLLPDLAPHFCVVAPDLPGHGFTSVTRASGIGLSMTAMAQGLRALLDRLDVEPRLIVGHSAGAALALRMLLDGQARPDAVLAFNGALAPFPGMVAPLFQGLARAVFANPLSAYLIALRARSLPRIGRLIAGTGSHLDARGVQLYARLFRTPGHVAGTLGMMAEWDLESLQAAYPRVRTPLVLAVGQGDRAVPPSTAERVRVSIPTAQVVYWPGLGHLAHEERPDLAAGLILDVARQTGVLRREAASA